MRKIRILHTCSEERLESEVNEMLNKNWVLVTPPHDVVLMSYEDRVLDSRIEWYAVLGEPAAGSGQ